jgi:hypothetical protein
VPVTGWRPPGPRCQRARHLLEHDGNIQQSDEEVAHAESIFKKCRAKASYERDYMTGNQIREKRNRDRQFFSQASVISRKNMPVPFLSLTISNGNGCSHGPTRSRRFVRGGQYLAHGRMPRRRPPGDREDIAS